MVNVSQTRNAPRLELLFGTRNTSVRRDAECPMGFLVPDGVFCGVFGLGHGVLFLKNVGIALVQDVKCLW